MTLSFNPCAYAHAAMSWRLRMWSSSRSLPGSAVQLLQQCAAAELVVGCVPNLDGRHELELDELGIDGEIQRDEIGARFLERRAVVLQRLVQRPDSVLDLPRAVADDLVQVDVQRRRKLPIAFV